jgi:hypothetical protein
VTVTPPDNLELIRRVLGKDYLELSLGHLSVDEDPEVGTRVKVTVIDGAPVEIEGHGVGVVDAIYNALLGRFAIEYQSLKSIALAGFTVDADVETTKKAKAGVDAVGTVTIDVINSEHRRFTFSDSSRSVTTSVGRAVLAVVQYFVNAERAFIMLHKARRDAMDRGRQDLVGRFTAELAEVVESTSYAEVIETIKKDAGVGV